MMKVYVMYEVDGNGYYNGIHGVTEDKDEAGEYAKGFHNYMQEFDVHPQRPAAKKCEHNLPLGCCKVCLTN